MTHHVPIATLPAKWPRALPEAQSCKDQPRPTSKASGLQLLIPDDGWGDPQIFSNFFNLLDVFVDKTTTQRHVKTA